MPSNIKHLFKITLCSLSLGVLASTAVYANEDISKLSLEKQAELNKLIAEAVKKAGIELDEEELTIVIVKKPDEQNGDNSNDNEGQVIGEVSSEQLSDIDDQTTDSKEQPEPTVAITKDQTPNQPVTHKESTSEPSLVAQPETTVTNQDVATEARPTDNTEAIVTANKAVVQEETKDEAVTPIIAPAATGTTALTETAKASSSPVSTTSPATPAVASDITPKAAEAIAVPTVSAPAITATEQTKAIPDTAMPNPEGLSNPPIPELTPYVEPVDNSAPAIADSTPDEQPVAAAPLSSQEMSENVITAPIQKTPEDTAVLQQRELEELQQTTAGSIKRAIQPNQHTMAPKPSNDYYGNYIPPERQVDAYYSSDIMEAIDKAGTSGNLDVSIPADQIAGMSIPAMASTEMSDLVVQGALDATAAGGVSTTTLKTAVVVPDDSVFDDLEEKDPNDQELEEIKKALDKEDLSQRVKEALALINQSKNRGSSSGSTNMGNLTATDVRVTANVQSRKTINATTTSIRQTNLSNTNFR